MENLSIVTPMTTPTVIDGVKKVESLSVYETTNYGLFLVTDTNRDINLNNVNKITKTFKEFPEFGLVQPITVVVEGKKYKIIDGHHRLQACIKAKVPIKFIILKGIVDDVSFMSMLNSSQLNWKLIDYVKGHASKGNQNYIEFLKFSKFFPKFAATAIPKILSMGGGKNNSGYQFRNGDFEVGDLNSSYQFAADVMDLHDESFGALKKTVINSKFLIALIKLYVKPNFNFYIFKKNMSMSKFQYIFDGTFNVKFFSRQIIEVHNYRLRESNRI